MTTSPPDDRHDLRDLLDDAVADVEPTDRLTAIRSRTRRARRTRRGWYAAGAAGLATAATVVAVAVVSPGGDAGTAPDVSDRSTPTAQDTTGAVEPPEGPTTAYYPGPGPSGPDAPARVLYPVALDGADALQALTAAPADPDYSTPWPAGSLAAYDVVDGRIRVTVTGGPVDDDLARQQVYWTLNSGPGADLPVDLVPADGRVAPIERRPLFEVGTRLTISAPAEGATVTGSFPVGGLSNGFEASVACWLRVDGELRHGPFVTTAAGWFEDRLYPWDTVVDLSGVAPGTYELWCTTDDPTGGAEGIGASVDTRTIVVE